MPTLRRDIGLVVSGGLFGALTVYLVRHWNVSSGRILESDTAVTDVLGHFDLDTKYYCPARLTAKAEGYSWYSGREFPCTDSPVAKFVDIVLEPSLQ